MHSNKSCLSTMFRLSLLLLACCCAMVDSSFLNYKHRDSDEEDRYCMEHFASEGDVGRDLLTFMHEEMEAMNNIAGGYVFGTYCLTEYCRAFMFRTCNKIALENGEGNLIRFLNNHTRIQRMSKKLPNANSDDPSSHSRVCDKHMAIAKIMCEGDDCEHVVLRCAPILDVSETRLYWHYEGDNTGPELVDGISYSYTSDSNPTCPRVKFPFHSSVSFDWEECASSCVNRNMLMVGIQCDTDGVVNCERFHIYCIGVTYKKPIDDVDPHHTFGINDNTKMKGYWKSSFSYYAGSTFTHTVEEGVESSSGEDWGKETMKKVSDIAEQGMVFEGSVGFGSVTERKVEASLEVEGEVTAKVAASLTQTFSMNANVKDTKSSLFKNEKSEELTHTMTKFVRQKKFYTKTCKLTSSSSAIAGCVNMHIYVWMMEVGEFVSKTCHYMATCGYSPRCLPGCCKDVNCQVCNSAIPACVSHGTSVAAKPMPIAIKRGRTVSCHVNVHDGTEGHRAGNMKEYKADGCYVCLYLYHDETDDRLCKRDGNIVCGLKLNATTSVPESGKCNSDFGTRLCCCDDKDLCSGGKAEWVPKFLGGNGKMTTTLDEATTSSRNMTTLDGKSGGIISVSMSSAMELLCVILCGTLGYLMEN